MKITAIIPAHNEEQNIERCVKSVLWCDEMWVLWSGTDKTGELAEKLGAKVIKRKSGNGFEEVQKSINWAIERVKTEWILRIDADEEVTPELKKEILEVIKQKNGVCAYGIPRNQFFWGGFFKGGDWYYDKLVRLFKKGKAKYDPIVPVHEQFKVDGEVGYLKNRLNHYSHPTLAIAVRKFNFYTDLESTMINIPRGKAVVNMFFRPVYVFARWFFYHHGYRDGLRGFVAGAMRGWYEFLVYAKYLEKNKSSEPIVGEFLSP